MDSLAGTGGGCADRVSAGQCARRSSAIPLGRMLRIYFLQLRFNLSGPSVEEVLYDLVAMR